MPYPFGTSGANVQSVARLFPQGVTLITAGRPNLRFVSIQNLDNQSVYFWHGIMPSGPTGAGASLPLDPTTWTPQQLTDAGTFLSTYGEKIAAGTIYSPFVAQTGPLYSYVPSGTAKCHVQQGDS